VNILQVLDLGLAILVLAVAGWTIAARELFASVVGYVAYGLLLSIVWIRLYAPDVALTEAAIGSGVTGVLLVTSGSRLRRAGDVEANPPPGISLRFLAAALALLVAAALAAVILLLPEPAPTLAPEAREGLAATGLGNPVTAVLIAYRSFDTMLEKVVLVLATAGVWSLAPDRFWGGAPAPLGRARPQGALLFLDQALVPLGVLVGIHIFWVGADEPGGAFQAGAILAAMWMIVMISRLTEPPRVSALWLRLALVAGPAVFLAAGLAGLGMAGSFFAYPAGFAKPMILFIEAFMLLTIAVTLPMLGRGAAAPESGAMSASTLAGLVGAPLVALGLYGLIVNPQPLRKILAFNLIGSGAFLVFGIVARRGAAAGFPFDPVPQAMVITGIVVAFAASALGVALILRLQEETGNVTLDSDAPATPPGDEAGAS
jgi:multisubunit Na+/H+ antiporter MnhB subunit/multisubunit Na+/H+ antiporter MnhC subunit